MYVVIQGSKRATVKSGTRGDASGRSGSSSGAGGASGAVVTAEGQ